MIFYGLVALAACIISIGLLLLKKPFFKMALASTSMVNALLDPVSDEDTKHKLVSRQLVHLLSSLVIFLFGLSTIVVAAYLPFLVYEVNAGALEMETAGIWFYGSMLVGGLLPFLFYRPKSSSDYSELSKLLHRMVLDNQHLSRLLFGLEKKAFLKKNHDQKPFLIITGLARSGTTALTQLLHSTGHFHSLTYANMPFLLSPNLWQKIYHPKNAALKERAHGDSIQFGFDTVEALEEYFFKVMTHDAFIRDGALVPHHLNAETIVAYADYRQLIAKGHGDSIYLAKNNNLLLRLDSLLQQEADMKVVLMLRDPLVHAHSLLKQHARFTKLQTEDPFVLEYMNWLGHHEFGLGHRPFQFENATRTYYAITDINYWLQRWIDYYQNAKKFVENGKVMLVQHAELANDPNVVLQQIGKFMHLDFGRTHVVPYSGRTNESLHANPQLLELAHSIYAELVQAKAM
ncbi:MAG: hypothetical protein RL266_226 [Bacteroidota bacterium]|jgi:hypothetical protein